MEEFSLIRLAQEGDTLAFRSLFEKNKQPVFSIAFHYLKNAEDAEDVLQDTFIKAYHALHKYSPEKGVNFGCWLNRICVNASIDALRRNKVREAHSLDTEEVVDVRANSPRSNPEKTALDKEIRGKIDQALDKLSPKQRMIFILRHYQEYNTREIAEYMNSTEGSVKKHLFRAVDTIKRRLRRLIMENDYGL